MLEGKCPKCGYHCAGWGLSFPRHQSCAKCGTAMLIFEDGQPLGVGYSPFSAEKHETDLKSAERASSGAQSTDETGK